VGGLFGPHSGWEVLRVHVKWATWWPWSLGEVFL
jgi:hypothetical protein